MVNFMSNIGQQKSPLGENYNVLIEHVLPGKLDVKKIY